MHLLMSNNTSCILFKLSSMVQVENINIFLKMFQVHCFLSPTPRLFFANQQKGCKEGQLHNLISLTPHVGLCPTDGENVDL